MFVIIIKWWNGGVGDLRNDRRKRSIMPIYPQIPQMCVKPQHKYSIRARFCGAGGLFSTIGTLRYITLTPYS